MIQYKLFTIFTIVIYLFSNSYPEIPITLNNTLLPSSVNNASTPHFRPIFKQLGNSCGSSSAIGNVFTYEINAIRNTSASNPINQYPYTYTYHFLNDGSDNIGTPEMLKDAWIIAMENGIPSIADFGGETIRFPTKWMSGYDKYYRAMNNRVNTFDSIKIITAQSLDTIKQWLVDHGSGSSTGGVGIITTFALSQKTATITTGIEAGKTVITKFGVEGAIGHAYTVVGYNDKVQYDFNKDGQYTNGDNVSEWEIGAVIIANTWGLSSFDNGFAYVPYRLLTKQSSEGGLLGNNHFYFCSTEEKHTVRAALKVILIHPSRNQIALSAGITNNLENNSPEKIKTFKKQFNYAGGNFPMCGNYGSDSIEIGLDISDLLDSIDTSIPSRVFLIINSKNHTGKVKALSLMNYTSGTLIETPSEEQNVNIIQGVNFLSVMTPTFLHSRKVITLNSDNQIHIQIQNSFISVDMPYTDFFSITIFDLQGKIHFSLKNLVTKQSFLIHSRLQNGFYIFELKNRTGDRQLKRFIITE